MKGCWMVILSAQSPEAEEYTDWNSAEAGENNPKDCPGIWY